MIAALSLVMTDAEGDIHQPTLISPFDPLEDPNMEYRDLRVSLSDTSYTYQVVAEAFDQDDTVSVSIVKTSGGGTVTIDGDSFTWIPSAGAVVTATVTVTHDEETESYTLLARLIGRAV